MLASGTSQTANEFRDGYWVSEQGLRVIDLRERAVPDREEEIEGGRASCNLVSILACGSAPSQTAHAESASLSSHPTTPIVTPGPGLRKEPVR